MRKKKREETYFVFQQTSENSTEINYLGKFVTQ